MTTTQQNADLAAQERDAHLQKLQQVIKTDEDNAFMAEFTHDLKQITEAALNKLQGKVDVTKLSELLEHCVSRRDHIQLRSLLSMKLSEFMEDKVVLTRGELDALHTRIGRDFNPESREGEKAKREALEAITHKLEALDQAEKAKKASGTPESPPKPVLSEAELKAEKEAQAKLKMDLRRELLAVEANLASAIAYHSTPKYGDDDIDKLLARIRAANLSDEANFRRPLELLAEHRAKLAKTTEVKAVEEQEAAQLLEVLHDHGFPADKKVEDPKAWQQVTDDLLRSLDSELNYHFKPQGAKAKALHSMALNMIAKAAQQRKLALKREIAQTKKSDWSLFKEPWSPKVKLLIAALVLAIVYLLDRCTS